MKIKSVHNIKYYSVMDVIINLCKTFLWCQTGSVPSFYRRSSERAVLGRDPGQYQYQVHQVVSNILHFQVVHDCQNDSAASYKV